MFPATAEAQSRYDRSWWSGSDEGDIDDEEEERATSRRGVSSSVQRKINDLDDDEVDDLFVPILFEVTVASLWPNFGDPRDGGSRTHQGLDIMATKGAYIVSPTEAVVTRTGKGSSAGTYVYTANPGGETFAYMHLDSIADGVKSGTVLKEGDLIGYVGNTGNASGGPAHLHFEVRDGRKATDPYPRITRDWSLKERMDAVTRIIADADDGEEEAENMVAKYKALFAAAHAQDIDLPQDIEDALNDAGVAVIPDTSGFARDLTLGSTGSDVTSLQLFLISEATGSAATTLSGSGATGYFGALTRAALAEYQAATGIAPAAGYFGPLTRARVTLALLEK
jgi:hypothetical protein